MTRLKPMRINSNQLVRLLREKIGDGFISYRFNEDTVEVIEFMVSGNGEIQKRDGTPLEYYCKNGDTIRYHVVSEKIQENGKKKDDNPSLF